MDQTADDSSKAVNVLALYSIGIRYFSSMGSNRTWAASFSKKKHFKFM